uniref:Uncharacterized protein LOC104220048 n=1 Tax=Nicotiana sylvestris TaxID=4096 RepID=A0A1U7W3E9_NICSY|nr:PREDICTED: uncharacterized protein LOC104220048 [Nicotiana sylvestris]
MPPRPDTRAQNIEADGLAKLAATTKNINSMCIHQIREQEVNAFIWKNKLEDAKGQWPELLLEVLWACRTMPKTSTGEMPYSLVYGTDTVIPIEVGEPSLRYSNKSGPSNDENRLQDLDEVEERRDMAHIRMVTQKQQVDRYYNKRAKVRPLKDGDYILKAKTQAAKRPY